MDTVERKWTTGIAHNGTLGGVLRMRLLKEPYVTSKNMGREWGRDSELENIISQSFFK